MGEAEVGYKEIEWETLGGCMSRVERVDRVEERGVGSRVERVDRVEERGVGSRVERAERVEGDETV